MWQTSAWIPNTELTPLDITSDAVKNPPEKGKSKTLLAAYAKAAEASDLGVFKKMLADHQQAIEEDLAAQEERAAKKAEKTKKSKSSEAAGDDEDGMDVDEDESAEKPKSKKRKKAADDSDADEKVCLLDLGGSELLTDVLSPQRRPKQAPSSN